MCAAWYYLGKSRGRTENKIRIMKHMKDVMGDTKSKFAEFDNKANDNTYKLTQEDLMEIAEYKGRLESYREIMKIL